MKIVELMHFIGTGIGFVMGIPAIVKNIKNRNEKGNQNPLNNLSVWGTAIMAFASFGRLPNILRGLLKAIKDHDSENIRRFILITFATSFVGLAFYIAIILISIYKDEKTEKEKKNKHIAQISTAVISALLLFNIVYFTKGLFTQ